MEDKLAGREEPVLILIDDVLDAEVMCALLPHDLDGVLPKGCAGAASRSVAASACYVTDNPRNCVVNAQWQTGVCNVNTLLPNSCSHTLAHPVG